MMPTLSVPVAATDTVPVTVAPEAGDMRATFGGVASAVMVKVSAADVPPPGAGVDTVTRALPAVATSLALIAAWSWVPLTHVVGRPAPFQRTSDEATKLVPVTVR